MNIAYYMKFVEPNVDLLDRVGGEPSHLPTQMPICSSSGEEAGFLAQFVCDEKLPIANARFLQVYQCIGVGQNETPFPSAIVLGPDDPPNDGRARQHPGLVPLSISWEKREDPDEIPLSTDFDESESSYYESKLGGTCPFEDVVKLGEKFLGQLAERPVGFNFGGYLCLLILCPDGSVRIEFQ